MPALKFHVMPRSVPLASRSGCGMSMLLRSEQRPEEEVGSSPGIQNNLLQVLRMQTRHTEST
jgi:hypothetical protein